MAVVNCGFRFAGPRHQSLVLKEIKYEENGGERCRCDYKNSELLAAPRRQNIAGRNVCGAFHSIGRGFEGPRNKDRRNKAQEQEHDQALNGPARCC